MRELERSIRKILKEKSCGCNTKKNIKPPKYKRTVKKKIYKKFL